MSKEIEMKQHILKMIEDMMMGNSSKKFKPKEIAIEVSTVKPMDKESLVDEEEDESPRHEAMESPEEEEMEHEEDYEDADADADEEDTKKPRMSLKDFLASR